jgi:hypothetical protein
MEGILTYFMGCCFSKKNNNEPINIHKNSSEIKSYKKKHYRKQTLKKEFAAEC